MLVAKLRDQGELFVDLFANLRRHARGPAALDALQGQCAQVLQGAHACGHEFLGILIVQSVE